MVSAPGEVKALWQVVTAVQLGLGLLTGLALLALYGKKKLIELEARFAGTRRLLLGLGLVVAGYANFALLFQWSRMPAMPFLFAGMTLCIILLWIGGQLLIWAPFGGFTKWHDDPNKGDQME